MTFLWPALGAGCVRDARARQGSQLGKKLYVGNLPFSTTEDELRSTFASHGGADLIHLPSVTQMPLGCVNDETASSAAFLLRLPVMPLYPVSLFNRLS